MVLAGEVLSRWAMKRELLSLDDYDKNDDTHEPFLVNALHVM
jgi:hypothetical protein